MRYFLTGGTGFLGNEVAQQLRAAGHEVHALVRSPEKAKELQSLGAKCFAGDVTDKGSMREAMRGVDGIFHVAGWYKIGTRDKSGGEKVNVQGTRNVLELMKELGIRKGVYTSTVGVNSDTHGRLVDETYHFTGRHLSEYERTKAIAHKIASQFIAGGLPLVIVMPGLIYGPGDTSTLRMNITDFLKGRLPLVPARAALCWAHVEDTARAHILAMEKGRVGETYIIAGEPQTLQDAFKLASQLTGKRLPLTIPQSIVKALSMLARPFDSILPETYTSEGLRIIAGVTYLGDNSKARRELGYDPRPFREGWEATLRHEMELPDKGS